MDKNKYRKAKKHNVYAYWMISGIMIIITLVIVEVFYALHRDSIDDSHRIESLKVAQSSAIHIQEEFNHKVYVVDTMKVFLINTGFDVSKFGSWAPYVYGIESGISSVQLAPDGIVQYIYPLEGNEGAIGHDLLKDKNRDDGARIAIKSDKLTFIGPVTLIQNQKQAFIVRRPVFIDDAKQEFWGFCTMVLLLEDISLEDYLDEELYDYWISGFNPDSEVAPYIYGNTPVSTKYDAKVDIAVPNGLWQLYVKRKNMDKRDYLRLLLFGLEFVLILCIIYGRMRKLKQDNYIYSLVKELQKANQRDRLTGAYNRAYFEETMKIELERHRRYNTTDSLLMFDVDYFKRINDQYGHQIGDTVLIKLSEVVHEHKRTSDIFARWGGEEFFLFMPGIAIEDACKVAEKLRKIIESTEFVKDEQVTCSFGVCEVDNQSYNDLFRRVDHAVYKAKENGRNQISL